MYKVLFYIDELAAGGAEKVLCDLVNHMDKKEFEITVKTLWPCDSDKYLSPDVKYDSVFKKKSRINQFVYRITAQLHLTYLLFLKGEYDIECAYLEMGPTKVISSSTNKKSVKLAWVHCDLQKKVGNIQKLVRKSKNQYKQFDEVICVSENVKNSFLELFGELVPVRVIYNVVDDEKIKLLSEDDLPSNITKSGLIVLSLGRLTNQKGYDVLLRVHKRLIGEGIYHTLWIAGEGEDRAKLEQFIKDQDLNSTAKLLGYASNPYPLLKAADILVSSSRYEGFSTFVTEGLILGKPIVTTDCTGMRELLGDSEYGLITELNEDALYKGLREMIQNENLRSYYERKSALRGNDFKADNLVNSTEAYLKKTAKEYQQKNN